MAGPLAGIGAAQQQIPLATPSQPSQGQQAIRQQESEPEANRVQPQGAAAAESQNTETGNQNNALQARASDFLSATNDTGQDVERGSVLDISV